MMASLTLRGAEQARKGLLERNEDSCNTVIADDEEIDTLEIQVDKAGIDIMLKFHPVASDMRNVIATMKFSVNLERIADQSVNIARRARKLFTRAILPEAAELDTLFLFTLGMLRDAVRAFADRDVELAQSVRDRDRDLDDRNRVYAERITDLMPVRASQIPGYMDIIFIARFLERMGDQCKSIAEDTIYAVSVRDIRHAHGK